jgi:hypothetical protein
MDGASGSGQAGQVSVHIANGRTKTPDEWAKEITDKLLYVADTAAEPIRAQAYMFKQQMYRVIRDNIRIAIEQERDFLLRKVT